MGKRLITQRRGGGKSRYRSPGHRFKSNAKYPGYEGSGQVIDILNDPGRTAPLAKILLENFDEILMIAPEGIRVGQWIELGKNAKPKQGSIMALNQIPEGTEICNIELRPGDGGKLVRASGGFASVISHDREKGHAYVLLPSKKQVTINENSRATIGKVASGGRREKPMAKAGQMYHAKKARGKLYPRVGGIHMNAIDHPHGGGRHPHIGRPSCVSRNTPPGRKVGHIAPTRTGRKKR
ncbi:MAG: 50S ribosomal protein L2 [Candidatus Altiarchaeales archaeon HGW-Altiarchaeales-3]|nr:MAG: 50S ribosomal protein L2 [Candidatus Altiarchaeales archaeon HGW-Altiarchaeales-3]